MFCLGGSHILLLNSELLSELQLSQSEFQLQALAFFFFLQEHTILLPITSNQPRLYVFKNRDKNFNL